MKTKGKDFYPSKSKTDIPREVFKMLGIEEDINDFSENTISGGGSTVTKQAWSKILKRLTELKEQGNLII